MNQYESDSKQAATKMTSTTLESWVLQPLTWRGCCAPEAEGGGDNPPAVKDAAALIEKG